MTETLLSYSRSSRCKAALRRFHPVRHQDGYGLHAVPMIEIRLVMIMVKEMQTRFGVYWTVRYFRCTDDSYEYNILMATMPSTRTS
jgi:hypothetical protein